MVVVVVVVVHLVLGPNVTFGHSFHFLNKTFGFRYAKENVETSQTSATTYHCHDNHTVQHFNPHSITMRLGISSGMSCVNN